MTRKLIDRLTACRQRLLRQDTRRDRRVHRPELEAFEARQMLSLVVWNTATDGNWNTAADWTVAGSSPAVHRLPGPTDDVQIETGHDITVTISSARLGTKHLDLGQPGHFRRFTFRRQQFDSGLRSRLAPAGLWESQRTPRLQSIARASSPAPSSLLHFRPSCSPQVPWSLTRARS